MLSPEGQPLAGFSQTDGEAIRGDALADPVRWARPLAALAGQPVKLEFGLKNARVFAFELAADPADQAER